MLRRWTGWMIALVVVIGGGILPAVLIVCAPSQKSPAGASVASNSPAAPTSNDRSPDSTAAATTDPSRPRLKGIAKGKSSSGQAPLSFADAKPTAIAESGNSEGAILFPVDERGVTAAPRSDPNVQPAVPAANGPETGETLAVRNVPEADSHRSTWSGVSSPATFGGGLSTATAPGEFAAPISPPIERTTAMRRAARHNQDGFALAAKGAWFSARAEFQQALELTVAAAVAVDGKSTRSSALRNAQTALREAADLAPRGVSGSVRVDVGHLVAGHRSNVIDRETARNWTAAAAHEAYLAYAKRQLADAGEGQQAASVALHGLGKVHAVLGADDRDHAVDSRKKARMYYEAALEVGPDNFIAANDLAVLLTEEGDFERGRMVLEAGLRISRQPAMLNNLASIYRRMGQPQAAEQLRGEAAMLERQAASGAGDLLPTHDVRWLTAQQFAATTRGVEIGRTSPPPSTASTAAPPAPVAGPPPAAATPRTAVRSTRSALVY